MNSEESIAASDKLEALLAAFKTGRIDGEETARQIRAQLFTDLGHTVLDTDRARRQHAAGQLRAAGLAHASRRARRPWHRHVSRHLVKR